MLGKTNLSNPSRGHQHLYWENPGSHHASYSRNNDFSRNGCCRTFSYYIVYLVFLRRIENEIIVRSSRDVSIAIICSRTNTWAATLIILTKLYCYDRAVAFFPRVIDPIKSIGFCQINIIANDICKIRINYYFGAFV